MVTFADIAATVQGVMAPWTGNPTDYWKGIYQALLWYEHGVPHIAEASDLKKPVWRRRAKIVELALAQALGCPPRNVPHRVDRLLRSPLLRGQQRQNPLGTGFAASLIYLLRLHSAQIYQFIPEGKIGVDVFRGITGTPPRDRVDITVLRDQREYAIISTKWSIRHDRLKDWLDECDFYKTRARLPFYFVVTNEYGRGRLRKVLQNQCQNGLYHVNRDLLLQLHDNDASLEPIEDLPALFTYFV
ncbi:MAG: hypothetical protein ACE5I9_04800 [Candidatus Methylomirabilales bacterium]